MKENELIKQAQKGDKKALTLLVKMHEQTIYNFAFKICRDKEKAENMSNACSKNQITSIRFS